MQREAARSATAAGRPAAARTDRLAGLGARIVEATHELKVPLSLIVGSLDQLESTVQVVAVGVRAATPADRSALEALETMAALVRICRHGATRLGRVVQQVEDYTRGRDGSTSIGRVDLVRLLRTTADLVARTAGDGPAMVLEIGNLPPVLGDEGALGQVFINLLRNAVEALADVAEPTIRISAGAHGPTDALPTHVEIRVRDNGRGIPAPMRPRVFEPFITGKLAGGGLGLGLAIAREIVEATRGTIDLAPGSGPGTEFVIRLPVAP